MAKEYLPYTFPKLNGSTKYKQWARDMSFALSEAELLGYITGDRIKPEIMIPTDKDDDVRIREIRQNSLDLMEFKEKEQRVVGKIGRMCSKDVQSEFLFILGNITIIVPQKLWKHLAACYTL